MAEVAPFTGIRYDQACVGELSKVVCPPYDVISPEERVYYHQLHPNNFVRLVLGEESADDSERNNRFTRARNYLEAWLADGILRSDDRPSIYVYEQRFERDGEPTTIRGITLAVRVHDYADGVILPHENTLAKPKSELAVLIRETRANLDSIYGLYADPDRTLRSVIDRAAGEPACVEALDRNGVCHRLCADTDTDRIDAVVEFLKDRPIAIADGHHRYETSLAFSREMRAESGQPEALESDYTLMTLVNVYERGMTIFPTHRVLNNLPSDALDRLEPALAEFFVVEPSSRGVLLADMARSGAIGLYGSGRALALKPKPGVSEMLSGSEASRRLELNVLHQLILERLLNIDEDKLRNQTHIHYTRDPEEAMALVDSGQRQMAFLLNHIDVKSVLDVASSGERMPQKATYFYPKLLSGLVLRKMDV